MKPFHNHVTKQQIFNALARGESPKEIAARYGIHVSQIHQHYQSNKRAHASKGNGRTPLLTPEQAAQIKEVLEHYPDTTLEEAQYYTEQEFGIRVSVSTLWRHLKRAGWRVHRGGRSQHVKRDPPQWYQALKVKQAKSSL